MGGSRLDRIHEELAEDAEPLPMEELRDVFLRRCKRASTLFLPEQSMAQDNFLSLCKDSGIAMSTESRNEAREVFQQVRCRQERTISFQQFLHALDKMSAKRGLPRAELRRMVVHSCHLSPVASSQPLHDNKTMYTGTAAAYAMAHQNSMMRASMALRRCKQSVAHLPPDELLEREPELVEVAKGSLPAPRSPVRVSVRPMALRHSSEADGDQLGASGPTDEESHRAGGQVSPVDEARPRLQQQQQRRRRHEPREPADLWYRVERQALDGRQMGTSCRGGVAGSVTGDSADYLPSYRALSRASSRAGSLIGSLRPPPGPGLRRLRTMPAPDHISRPEIVLKPGLLRRHSLEQGQQGPGSTRGTPRGALQPTAALAAALAMMPLSEAAANSHPPAEKPLERPPSRQPASQSTAGLLPPGSLTGSWGHSMGHGLAPLRRTHTGPRSTEAAPLTTLPGPSHPPAKGLETSLPPLPDHHLRSRRPSATASVDGLPVTEASWSVPWSGLDTDAASSAHLETVLSEESISQRIMNPMQGAALLENIIDGTYNSSKLDVHMAHVEVDPPPVEPDEAQAQGQAQGGAAAGGQQIPSRRHSDVGGPLATRSRRSSDAGSLLSLPPATDGAGKLRQQGGARAMALTRPGEAGAWDRFKSALHTETPQVQPGGAGDREGQEQSFKEAMAEYVRLERVLEAVYVSFSLYGAWREAQMLFPRKASGMSLGSLQRLTEASGLMDDSLTADGVGIIFWRVRDKGSKTLTFPQFQLALSYMAHAKAVAPKDVRRAVIALNTRQHVITSDYAKHATTQFLKLYQDITAARPHTMERGDEQTTRAAVHAS